MSKQVELRRLRREILRLREELSQLRAALRHRGPPALYAFVERERQHYAVGRLCGGLGVSSSGYWAWRTRPPSARAREDDRLLNRIRAIHATSGGTFGARRIHEALKSKSIRCGYTRIARLMRSAGLWGSGLGGVR